LGKSKITSINNVTREKKKVNTLIYFYEDKMKEELLLIHLEIRQLSLPVYAANHRTNKQLKSII